MTTIPLPFTAPPLTQNKLRRMHHMVEARMKADALGLARHAIARAHVAPMAGANVVLHWRMADRRRQDGDGAAPTLKVCLDALVLEGVIADDSWRYVIHSGVTTHPPIKGQPGALWLELSDPEGDRMTTATCQVTVWDKRENRNSHTQPCGEPVAADDLCAKHLADKERLS